MRRPEPRTVGEGSNAHPIDRASADTAGVLERAAREGMDMTVGAEEVLQDYFSRLEDYEDQGIRKFNLSRYLGARAAERYREKADRVEMSEEK